MDKYQKMLTIFISFMTALLIVGIILLTMILNKPKDIQINNMIGTKGDSAYQIAQKHGFSGTEVEWLNSLVGKDSISTQTVVKTVETIQLPGIQIPGPVGPSGINGTNGNDGPAGKKQLTWFDKDTCTLYTKYEWDRFWEELNKFPSPCTVEE